VPLSVGLRRRLDQGDMLALIMKRFVPLLCSFFLVVALSAAVPVQVVPVHARHGVVVAAHPQASAAGLGVLQAGGNAIDAAVATALALGVAEPYGSGLGGKLMLLYFEAKSGRTYVVDAMDAAGSLDVAAYRARPDEDRSYGYGSVCVPGLAAGLWTAHQRWGKKPWADDVAPAITLARRGFEILPKTRDFFEEQEKKLRRGDAELARLYLPNGALPVVGTHLANEDLARTMERLAREGRHGFYRGPVAEAIVAASERGGGVLTRSDFAAYEARVLEPISVTFRGYTLVCAPPPSGGAALFLPIMKVLENETMVAPLRSAENLDRIGRVWRVVSPQTSRVVADAPESRFLLEKLLAPDSIAALRSKAVAPAEAPPAKKVAALDAFELAGEREPFFESSVAATTHFLVADAQGNIVCATQSQSLHFGAGVVPPGTGVVLNDSMSNFAYTETKSLNFVAPGKRPRSTISPTIVFRDGKPEFALGIPGAARIPTAMLQALLDRLMFGRPLAEAIGDTRVHFVAPIRRDEVEAFESEASLPVGVAEGLRQRGWKVVLPEEAGRGRHFGGLNAIDFNADGSMTGYADPRRTNVAAGY
jgi:gamma-glutamyltranspeptidase/glutathione hydrolase